MPSIRSYGRRSAEFAASDVMRERWTGSSRTLCRYKSLVRTREELGSLCLLSWEMETPMMMKTGSL